MVARIRIDPANEHVKKPVIPLLMVAEDFSAPRCLKKPKKRIIPAERPRGLGGVVTLKRMLSRKRGFSKEFGGGSKTQERDGDDSKSHSNSAKYVIGVLLLIVGCLAAFGTYQKPHNAITNNIETTISSTLPAGGDSVHDFTVINLPNDKLRGGKPDERIDSLEKSKISDESQEMVPKATVTPLLSLESRMLSRIEELRAMKAEGVVMESDAVAQQNIKETQELIRQFLTQKYGPGPYMVAMKIKFPESMPPPPPPADQSDEATILIELAPIADVPYSVYMFLEHIVAIFKSGSFHRNAGHVLQAMLAGPRKNFAWQEYSPAYPHRQYTLGYAGRPSGSTAIYISTLDNTRNHGPASQGSKSEADRCVDGLPSPGLPWCWC